MWPSASTAPSWDSLRVTCRGFVMGRERTLPARCAGSPYRVRTELRAAIETVLPLARPGPAYLGSDGGLRDPRGHRVDARRARHVHRARDPAVGGDRRQRPVLRPPAG